MHCTVAYHGLDNNWNITIYGQIDAARCVRVSSIDDNGAAHHVPANPNVSCVQADLCPKSNSTVPVPPHPPTAGFGGCKFDSHTSMWT